MARKQVSVISSSKFVYNGTGRIFEGDAAEMRTVSGSVINFLMSCYSDAADLGFDMKSSETGKIVRFYLDDIITNEDGDIKCWTFESEHPYMFKAIIYND